MCFCRKLSYFKMGFLVNYFLSLLYCVLTLPSTLRALIFMVVVASINCLKDLNFEKTHSFVSWNTPTFFYSYPQWGENTLQWPPLGCHIVLLSKDVHVWMYPTSNFWKIFIIFLHIILEYKLGQRFFKNYFISFYKVRDYNIFVEMNVMYLCTQKHKYTPKKI